MNTLNTQPSQTKILLVDDTLQNLELLSDLLKRKGFNVRCAINGSVALGVAQSGWADLILLDIKMPEIDGYEVCKQLKKNANTREIPVIFLSALDSILDKKQAFAAGGADYISKPFQIEEVLVRINNQLAIVAAKQKVCQLNLELEQRVRERTSELEKTNQQLKEEIVQRKRTQKKLLYLAMYDPLTDLPNRILFMQRLNNLLQQLAQDRLPFFAVLFLDCDRFKLINDSLGHFVGDQVLSEIARRIKICLKPSDTLARFGGDEFMVLLSEMSDINQASRVAQKIQNQLQLPFEVNRHQLFISASIGIVLGNENYKLAEHVLRDADTAMYQAKKRGKACHQVFNPKMHRNASKRLKLETDLRLALKREELAVYYQPIIALDTGSLIGFEALVRWNHPKRGFVSPVEFIPVAEETGLIVPLGLWVMRSACQQFRIWQHKHSIQQLKISVNLSVKQFYQPDFIEQIDRILQETQLDSQNLKLEITESAIVDNAESATLLFQKLRQREIQLSIDDFGTGYSSLSYLHRFPVNTLKIDRSFVSRIGKDGENLEIIQAIVTLAKQLGMTIVAEGIETTQQKDYLKALDCDEGQGYLFAKPLPTQEVETIFDNLDSLVTMNV
ncbi:diguanylate cyclase (GGDEF) domain-containing protein [Xenococcus sp. PCC 7305]|uniref:two-component system response regulator n=1 Tax=Xenococcus sp. PCC 7305 TaxID=102125 RepID=UPI0002AC7F32|nr:GGDEF domain-containing response regulator [Xenococcus sp. PCC 7305]ELS05361.1 diguanylate cyclase (GGDEF) domain-containing protein [Xenococcus sp. PCC 7305]